MVQPAPRRKAAARANNAYYTDHYVGRRLKADTTREENHLVHWEATPIAVDCSSTDVRAG